MIEFDWNSTSFSKGKMEEHRKTLFVPVFICRQHSLKNRGGTLDGSVLICDIAGFTGLTESLFTQGKKGAEKLSDMINGLFTMMIAAVGKRGGFVANFAGDAFTAVFPGDDCSMARLAAEDVSRGVSGLLTKDASSFIAGIRSGVSCGPVRWNIYGSGPFAYLFGGEPVNRAAAAEASAAPGEVRVACAGPSWSAGPTDLSEHSVSTPGDIHIQQQFVHPDCIARSPVPEFRDVSAVFTGFHGICDMDGFMDGMLRTAREYGGYFNLLDSGDKGNIVLTVFGAPLTSGRNRYRAVSYALALQETYGRCVRSGISSGRVFAGFIGSPGVRGHYTVLGDTVNGAARLMQNCPRGEVRVSLELGTGLPECFKKERGPSSSVSEKGFFTITGRTTAPGDADFDNSFVGRGELLEAVLRLAGETGRKEQAGAIIVSGEAGIGKTRFVLELKSRLDDTELIYLKCDEILRKSLNPIESFFEEVFRTSGFEGSSSGPVFERSFRSLLARAGTGDAGAYHAGALERLEFVIRGFMGIEDGGLYAGLDPRARFDNTILAFRHLAGLLAGGKRPLVVVDDFQWIDRDSLAALGELFSQMEIENPLLCAVTRTPCDTLAQELMPVSALRIVAELDPLSRSEQDELIESSFRLPPSRELRELVWEKAEGNPFFLQQIVRYLKENEQLRFSAEAAELASKELNLPGSVVEMIISRVDALESDIRNTVRNATVLGRRFNTRVLSGMLQGQPVSRHLASGHEAGIWNRLTELQYIFKHALIRDAIYETQMGKPLAGLHLLAGNIIEELYRHDERMFSDMSYHFQRCGQTERMLKYTLMAAEYAGENYRNREAIEMYVKYLKNQPDPGLRKEPMIALAEIYRLTGEWEAALELFDELLLYGEEADDRSLLASTMNRKGFILHRMGLNDLALELMTAAAGLHRELGDNTGLASVHNNTGTVYIDQNRLDEAIEVLGRGLAILESDEERRSGSEVAMFICSNLGLALQKKNSLDTASDYYRQSMEIGEAVNSRWSLAALNFGNIMYLQNRYDEAERYYLRAMSHAQETGDRHLSRVMLNNLAAIAAAGHDFPRALDLYEEALVLATSLNDRKGIRLLYQNMGEIKTLLGDYDGAEACLGKAVETARRLCDERALGTAVGKAGWMHLVTGRPEEAIPMLEEGAERSLTADNPQAAMEFMWYLALARLETGDGEFEDISKRMRAIPSDRMSDDRLWYLPAVDMLAARRAGDTGKTVKAAERVAKEHPDTEAGALALGLLWEFTGDRSFSSRAAESCGKLFQEAPLPLYTRWLEDLKDR